MSENSPPQPYGCSGGPIIRSPFVLCLGIIATVVAGHRPSPRSCLFLRLTTRGATPASEGGTRLGEAGSDERNPRSTITLRGFPLYAPATEIRRAEFVPSREQGSCFDRFFLPFSAMKWDSFLTDRSCRRLPMAQITSLAKVFNRKSK